MIRNVIRSLNTAHIIKYCDSFHVIGHPVQSSIWYFTLQCFIILTCSLSSYHLRWFLVISWKEWMRTFMLTLWAMALWIRVWCVKSCVIIKTEILLFIILNNRLLCWDYSWYLIKVDYLIRLFLVNVGKPCVDFRPHFLLVSWFLSFNSLLSNHDSHFS